MTDPALAPPPPIFNFNAYSPAEIHEAIEKVGVKKATIAFLPSFMLAVVAGGSIGLGALYYTIVACDPDLSFATIRVVGGIVFSLGLALVLVGGAELFTGNNLIVMAWASGKISTRQVLRNWVIVYCGNFVGSIGLVILVFFSHHLDMNGGRIGLTHIEYCGRKDQPRRSDPVLQGHPVQSARVPGRLAGLCWPLSNRQDRRADPAGISLRGSGFRALRCQYVFSADGLAPHRDWQGSGRF